jgi:hypothetical protein
MAGTCQNGAKSFRLHRALEISGLAFQLMDSEGERCCAKSADKSLTNYSMSAVAEEAKCKILSAECRTKHNISCAAINPLTPKDLQRRRTVSPLKIKIPSKNMREKQQIQQLFIQFINYVW